MAMQVCAPNMVTTWPAVDTGGLPSGLPPKACLFRPLICGPAHLHVWRSDDKFTDRLLQPLPAKFDLLLPCAGYETQLDTRFSADDVSERFSAFRDARTFAKSASEHSLPQEVCRHPCLTLPCLAALASLGKGNQFALWPATLRWACFMQLEQCCLIDHGSALHSASASSETL